MNMKQILTLTILLMSTIWSQAQQVNPVPDYVFRNQMSVGRNAVTDTAAYFSIGPRYGANKGFMPPIVGDTATFSSGKRNGLLIFSVQKNKYLYWDSVGVKWAEMAGTAGTALTSADTAALLSTRAWRQKGIDSIAAIRIAGSGTSNYIPKFTASTTIGNSNLTDNGTTLATTNRTLFIGENVTTSDVLLELGTSRTRSGFTYLDFISDSIYTDYGLRIVRNNAGINATSTFEHRGIGDFIVKMNEAATYKILRGSLLRLLVDSNGFVGINISDPGNYSSAANRLVVGSTSSLSGITIRSSTTGDGSLFFARGTSGDEAYKGYIQYIQASDALRFGTNANDRGRINSSGEWILNSSATDQGDFKLQVTGAIWGSTTITTGAPTDGTAAPWRLGSYNATAPTATGYVEVLVNGVKYKLLAATY